MAGYTESMFFGLSLRQFFFSTLACGSSSDAPSGTEASGEPETEAITEEEAEAEPEEAVRSFVIIR